MRKVFEKLECAVPVAIVFPLKSTLFPKISDADDTRVAAISYMVAQLREPAIHLRNPTTLSRTASEQTSVTSNVVGGSWGIGPSCVSC